MNQVITKLSTYIDYHYLFNTYISKVYQELKHLDKIYPNFNHWFYNKVITGIHKKEREILIYEYNHHVAGISIIKNSEIEKKVSTLYVNPIYRKMGIGKKLLIHSMDILNTDKPLITLTSSNYVYYKRIFDYFNFCQTDVIKDLYVIGFDELIYNTSNKL